MVARRPLRRYLNQSITLGANQERYFGPYPYYVGQTIEVTSFGSVRHYVGVFNAQEYARRRAIAARPPGRFPFSFGSDRTRQHYTFNATGSGQLYVVVRVGVFNPSGGTIQVVLDVG